MDISVVIPVYNSESTIVESMDSVVRECAANAYEWELILVDDGSKDNSVNLIEQYIAASPHKEHIKLLKQPNGGAAVARNTGIRVATGEFIAFNDSDDRWLPGKIAIQTSFFAQNQDVDCVAAIYGQDNMSKIKTMEYATPIRINDQVLKNYFSPPTVMFRRSILERTGLFDPKMRYSEEFFFFINVVYLCSSKLIDVRVAEPIDQKERWGERGLSGNLLKMEQGELFAIRWAYRQKYISSPRYLFAYLFSVAKFVRRWCISKIR